MFSKSILTAAVLSLTSFTPMQAETYITEEKVQIDRCACAWFITRFLDPEPNFVFIKQGEKPPAGVTYDFYGAKYFHRGPDCSFTSFVKTHIKQKNTALIEINKIVNDVFSWQSGPNSLSIAIKEHIDTLAESGLSDEEIYQATLPIFDLLYLAKGGLVEPFLHSPTLDVNEMTLLTKIYENSIEITTSELLVLNKESLTQKLLKKNLTQTLEADTPVKSSLRTLCLKILTK